MNHNEMIFNTDIAMVCGIREAVIANFLWKQMETSEDTAYRHGTFWVRCTQRMMTVHMPFLTEKMISNSVRKLADKGIIRVKKLKEENFDHAYWYTFTDYGNELMDIRRCLC